MLLYSYISHLYEETLPPDFVIGLFQINKDGDHVFVHLESILNFLYEYIQLVFCGVATSEASLACCDDIVVFEPPIQTFGNYPFYQCSDIYIYDVSDVGFVVGWSLFALFFFIKGIRTAVFQSFGSCPVFHCDVNDV